MTENLAGRGEGLAGLVAKWRAEIEKCCPVLFTDANSNFADASCRQQLRDVEELEAEIAALEAAARLPSAPECPKCGSPMRDNTAFYLCQNRACLKAWSPVALSIPTQWQEIPLQAALATPSPQAPTRAYCDQECTLERHTPACQERLNELWREAGWQEGTSAATQEQPAGSGALETWLAAQRVTLSERQLDAVKGYIVMNLLPVGSPRKVGEDGTGRHCEITGTSVYDCYTTQCPDCPYPELKLSREEAINAICLQAAEIVALKAALSALGGPPTQHLSNAPADALKEAEERGRKAGADPGSPRKVGEDGGWTAQDRMIVGDEINQCLQIIVTNAGNIKSGVRKGSVTEVAARRIEKAVARAAKAVRAFVEAYTPRGPSSVPVGEQKEQR